MQGTERAECLGAALRLYLGSPDDPRRLMPDLNLSELEAIEASTEEDMHLTNACLEAEAWVEGRRRRREFGAAERLLAVGMFGEEEASDLLEFTAPEDLGRVAGMVRDLLSLGFLD